MRTSWALNLLTAAALYSWSAPTLVTRVDALASMIEALRRDIDSSRQ